MLNRVVGSQNQHAITRTSTSGMAIDGEYTIRLGRHGSVAIGRTDVDVDSALRSTAQDASLVRRLWSAGVSILDHLGAIGPTHVALRLSDNRLGSADIARWSVVAEVTDEELESIKREAARSLGQLAYEP
jgi:hypothetical protein